MMLAKRCYVPLPRRLMVVPGSQEDVQQVGGAHQFEAVCFQFSETTPLPPASQPGSYPKIVIMQK
jgi:hypothetical protein